MTQVPMSSTIGILLSGISANVGSSGFRLMIYWQMMV
jgi:hypothetical protein